jgi:hypothetical protein
MMIWFDFFCGKCHHCRFVFNFMFFKSFSCCILSVFMNLFDQLLSVDSRCNDTYA